MLVPSQVRPFGMHTAIVGLLREYRRSVSIDFLAYRLDRRPEEILPYLKTLEEQAAIRLDDGMVSLA